MNSTEFKELLINVVGSINTGEIKIADYKIVTNDKGIDMSKASIKVQFIIKNSDYEND